MNDAIKTIRAYHQATKHRTSGYAPSPGFLDWDSQPDPFRRFAGAQTIALPLVRGEDRRSYDDLYAADERAPTDLTPQSLGLFLELALGLSAWKGITPERWALRNNPSSGNLHPTEGYVLLWRAASNTIGPGLYHYAPHDHALERRAVLSAQMAAEVAEAHPHTFGAFGLSTIPWREEWKYGARAYRYCQHDVGHALAGARLAAGVLGWGLTVDTAVGDDAVDACLGLDRRTDFGDAEAEHPDLLAVLGSPVAGLALPWGRLAQALTDWNGAANQLSAERVAWPQIAKAVPAVHKGASAPPPPPVLDTAPVDSPRATPTDACALIRQRRSAQRMDGHTTMERGDFERALGRTLPVPTRAPFDAFPFAPAVNLVLFVHAVGGLEPGLYALIRAPQSLDAFRRACALKTLTWKALDDTSLPLYRLDAPTDYRKTASQISCYQGIAGRGAFSLGMIAALGPVLEREGAWAYRRLHWEAGMIGQVLYLEAEAAGLRGTGIGCFFDDEVHNLLGLDGGDDAPWQTLYHFTVGGPIEDQRLVAEPAYAHLSDRSFE